MLRTRLWMGALLILLALAVLGFDNRLAPVYPLLLVLLLLLSATATYELVGLLDQTRRPAPLVTTLAIWLVLVSNWLAHVFSVEGLGLGRDPWHWVLAALVVAFLGAFLYEMATFRDAATSIERLALMYWSIAYLGFLASFFAQLRWLGTTPGHGSCALALAIFVPKCGDIGAYFVGRRFGRRPMAPVLSPKKTWEGAAGGVAASVVATIVIDRALPSILNGILREIGFGITVGTAGMLGDLAESLIKRAGRFKDASQAVPGFGGVLDVLDAIIFAAPVAYAWLA
jgi:phosphatidate cytidylyltransferase